MGPTSLRILLLDPNFVTRIALTSRLEAVGFMVRAEKTINHAARAATAANWDLILASASLAAADLEAFLETLAITEVRSILCVVTDQEDKPRCEIAGRYSARILRHPVRPQSISEFFETRPPAVREKDSFFRTA
jgi:DNA-binding NarL/FixJ family response regulator